MYMYSVGSEIYSLDGPTTEMDVGEEGATEGVGQSPCRAQTYPEKPQHVYVQPVPYGQNNKISQPPFGARIGVSISYAKFPSIGDDRIFLSSIPTEKVNVKVSRTHW